ncbi:MAG: phosphomannomutase/phosphoglucomutase [Nanoarchaeota archaeon]|nr:phosphomannomutase/phosphoglucomutase [Nanoarchaeota archaeon]
MGIFKAYDIRAIYPNEINEEIMEKIGKAFADFIDGNKIAVGYDMRLSGKSLSSAFVKGITAQGKDVLDFGLTSTPMSYFASNYLKADGTTMITASHNPKEYNGAKFTREKAIPISGDTGIKEIEKKVMDNDFKYVEKQGKIIKYDIKEAYKDHLLSFAKDIKKLKVVVDCANGMGSQDFSLIQDELPIEVIPLYFEIDGSFPNHDANPMKEGAMDDLEAKVIEEKADLGIAFDGDADRIFFVDDKGELLQSDFITALIAEEILKYNKGAPILYDLRSSWIVPEKIKEFGGKPIMCRVGHSFIKESMRKENAPFAGELSGHIYFEFPFDGYKSVYDSAIVTAMWVLNLLSAKDKKMSELVEPLKKYFPTGEINSKVEDKEAKMDELRGKYKDGNITLIDGVRIDFNDWWFNVRQSNTEPLLRLNLEAKTKELMEEKRDEVLNIIRS